MLPIKTAILLFSVTASGHCTKVCTDVIPENAVEPIMVHEEPICPREDYKLKWFVVYSATLQGWSDSGNGVRAVYGDDKRLKFQPMCVIKGEDDAAPSSVPVSK
jgi:hypothetical protein